MDRDDAPCSEAEARHDIGPRRHFRECLLRVADGERSPYCADLPRPRMTPSEIHLQAFRVAPPKQMEMWG